MRKTRLPCLLFSLLIAGMLWAQSDRGTITGTVTDSSGAVIPNATVKATSVATRVETSAVTNETGVYQLSNLPIGMYRITASMSGFKTYERTGFELTVAQTARLDIALAVGLANETVTVEANAQQLNTSDAMIAATIQSKVVTDMPLTFGQEGRTIENFAFMVTPGVEGDAWESRVGGSQTFAKEVVIDGISAHTQIQGDNMETAPTMEAIQEFKVQTSGMSAEYGRNTGGTFNFALKSGTNQFHGSGFYYGRNEALNANSWLNNHGLAENGGSDAACEAAFAPNPCPYSRQRDRSHLYGFSGGVPLVIPGIYNGKDRTFIFATYENFIWEMMSLGALDKTVPTAAFLDGDFSALLTSNQVGTDALGRPIYAGQIYDPSTMHQVNGMWVSDPFVGNIIPSDRISPLSQKIIDIYRAGPYQPMIDRVANNWRSAANQQPWFRQTQLVFKADHNFSSNNRLSGSFIWSSRPRYWNSGLWLPQFGKEGGPLASAGYDKVTGRRVAISDNWTLTPNVMNTLSLAYNRYYKDDSDTTPAYGGWAASQGLTQATTWPQYFGLTGYTTSLSFPEVDFGRAVNGVGETGFGGGAPGGWAGQTYILSDTVSWLHGKHSFKLGGEVWHMMNNAFPTTENALHYNFQNTTTGIPGNNSTGFGFASFLLGEVDSASRDVPYTSHPRRNYFALFFQDDYRLSQKLTLNLGLRWEQTEAMTEAGNIWSNFNTSLTNTALNVPGAWEFASSDKRSFDGGKDWKSFSPRLSFAYALGDKSVIRGGYGIYYAPIGLSYWFGVPYASYGGMTGFLGLDNIPSSNNRPAFNWDDPNNPGGGFYPSTGIVEPVKDPNQTNWGTVTMDPKSLTPGYTHQFNIGFERSLTANDLVQVSFVGNLGRRLHDGNLRRNQPSRAAYEDPTVNVWEWQNWCPDNTTMFGGVRCPFEGFWGYAGQALQPFPQIAMTWGPLWYVESPVGSSSYNSLQLSYNRRMSKGLAAQVAYTFSKTKGNTESNWQEGWSNLDQSSLVVQDMNNLAEAADTVTRYDQTHVFKGLVMYELPFGRGRTWWAGASGVVNAIVGGWTVSTIFKYNSGFPLAVTPNVWYPGWEGYVYADVNPGVSMGRNWNSSSFDIDNPTGAGNTYFNTAAFSDPQGMKLGNGKRYYEGLRGFGSSNEDVGIIKYFKVRESMNLQLRAELLNAFNRHHFADPDTNIGDGGYFGKVTNLTGEPRIVQFGLRFSW